MAETKDFIDVTIPTAKQNALKELRKIEQEYTKNGKPFDRYGAMMDFEDLCIDHQKKVERAVQRKTEVPAFKNTLNWEDYGKPSRFKLLKEEEEFFTNTKTGHVMPQKVIYKTFQAVSGGNYKVRQKENETETK
jgi:hypothetical protein